MEVSKISPCLCFDGQAEEAAVFYTSVFEDGAVLNISRYEEANPHRGAWSAGTAMMIAFSLAGQTFQALNCRGFKFTEAMSLFVRCKDQAEVDRLRAALTSNGGSEGQGGWIKDKFGVSWQLIKHAACKQ